MAETEAAATMEEMEAGAKMEGTEGTAADSDAEKLAKLEAAAKLEELDEAEAAAKCEGVELLEPTELYNILNNNQGSRYPMLSDPSYLVLYDIRILKEYAEDHIVTAKRVKKYKGGMYELPEDTEFETKQNIVVYDNRTSKFSTKDSAALRFARFIWDNGSKYTVKVLKGGYELFSALYPFLRTQVRMYTPQELDKMFLYPVEIMPTFLYIGNYEQSQNPKVNKDLKIKAHVNVTKKKDKFIKDCFEALDDGMLPMLHEVPVSDDKSEDLLSFFETTCSFIDGRDNAIGGYSVLVFSDLGISRSVTIALAYLIHRKKISLQDAWNHMKRCKIGACPNRSFIDQLLSWEQQVLGEKLTDINMIEP